MENWNGPGGDDDKIVRRKLSDQVLERLREMIVRGELAPGDLMPSERELMKRFGVGRPAVREAMQSMHTQGLITISHGERSRVSELSADLAFRQMDMVARMLLSASSDNLEYLKEARRLFEVGMVKIATEKATKEDIAELEKLLATQRTKLGNPSEFIKADIAFHSKISAISGNPILAAVCDAMLTWLFNYHADLLIWSGRENVTLEEHQKIIECIASGDPAAAASALGTHLNRSKDLYRHHNQAE
ncbi:transcriptional regulator NanR [uncultured Roseibium sp.]|uniref:transcriptional regulator NanR n=1 Tax=uncultured Roseibium sp. TaxID=1936171 RepID=UPI002634FFBF|nr:transcriptional regulator NanR [uncultured Roseibium sp.]